MGRAVEADVDLPLEALTQQAVGDGGQVVYPLPHADLHSAAARGGGSGVEIRQSGQHKAVTGLGHPQGVSLADDGLAVQRKAAVHLDRADRHNDDVVVLQIFLDLAVEHLR